MGVLFSSIFSRLFGKREMRLLMIGLDAAGKTTILYKLNLQLGEVATPIPTIGFNVETFEYKNISFTVWDVGYQSIIISLWKPYFKGTKGLIFVVDCNDHERIELAAEALKMVMEDVEMRDVVLLVLANKQDLPEAMTVSEVTDRLGLHTLRGRQWFVQPTCAVHGSGLYEGLDWLSDQLSKQQLFII